MTTEQKNILEKHLKGFTLTVLWSIVIGTGLGVFTVSKTYYINEKDKDDMKALHMQDIQELQSEITLLKWRIERLEKNK